MQRSLRGKFALSRWWPLLLVAASVMWWLPAAATRAKSSAVAPQRAISQSAPCTTICLRGPQYYLANLDRLPGGAVTIPGVNINAPIGAGNKAALRLALRGGAFAPQRFSQQFVAAQLALLVAPGYRHQRQPPRGGRPHPGGRAVFPDHDYRCKTHSTAVG